MPNRTAPLLDAGSMLRDRWHREQRTTSKTLGEFDRLDDTVLMLSSLLLELIWVGLVPVAACDCSCRIEGLDIEEDGDVSTQEW